MPLKGPYLLSAIPAYNVLCAMGPDQVMSDLSSGPGAMWGDGPNGKYLVFPASRETCLGLEAIAPVDWASDEYIAIRNYCMAPDPEEADFLAQYMPPLQPGKRVMTQQMEFMARVVRLRGGINGSDRGTGKTATGWLLSRIWGINRHLIVATAPDEWASQQHDIGFGDDCLFFPLNREKQLKIKDKAELIRELVKSNERIAIGINYEILDKLKDTIIEYFKPELSTFDESWKLKSDPDDTKVSRAAIAIADCSHKVLLMNGSPIGNHAGDLWTHLRMMSTYRMDGIEPYKDFFKKFVKTETVYFGSRQAEKPVGCLDPMGLIRRTAPFYYRASKATCLDLEPKIRKPVQLELTEEQESFYAEIEKHGEGAIDALSLAGERITTLRLQQINDGVCIDGVQDAELIQLDSCKLNWLLAWAANELVYDRTRRALIWVKYNGTMPAILAGLEAMGLNAVGVAGQGSRWSKSDKQLSDLKYDFNSRDRDAVQIMVCQIKKMAFSHNLQAADHHVKMGRSWSRIEDEQSEDRSHRAGRNGAIMYWELEAVRRHTKKPTKDRDIINALKGRQDIADRLAPDTASKQFIERWEDFV